jgi:hypothetical protein
MALRAQGYLVANVLAGIDAPALVAEPGFPEAFAQLLVERFLVGADNGWIFRRAQHYRGALQVEDEREGARARPSEGRPGRSGRRWRRAGPA